MFIAALNGLAVLQAYFRVFTGTRSAESIDLQVRLPERIAVLTLTALILGGGLYPQPNVASRYEVAAELVRERSQQSGQGEPVQASAPAHSGVLDCRRRVPREPPAVPTELNPSPVDVRPPMAALACRAASCKGRRVAIPNAAGTA